jgi:hypothetical protein
MFSDLGIVVFGLGPSRIKLQLTPLFVAIIAPNTEIKTLLQLAHI